MRSNFILRNNILAKYLYEFPSDIYIGNIYQVYQTRAAYAICIHKHKVISLILSCASAISLLPYLNKMSNPSLLCYVAWNRELPLA